MKIIVLEDEKAVADKLCDYIGRYCSESNVPVEVQVSPTPSSCLKIIMRTPIFCLWTFSCP